MIGTSGKVITFYSYKGGTGRTMALSNVAWILASNGFDVLLIDWDLEAPGLHRYLRPFLVDPEIRSSRGVIDFVWDAARVNVTPAEQSSQPSSAKEAAPEFPSLEDYVIGLDWDFRDNGSISFIPAGRQDENYAQRVNTFSWDNFYQRLGGGRLLQAEIEALRKSYDYILIDSRTGVSDTSGICTVQLPDVLAVFFTLNWQSIKGAAAVAASVQAQRGTSFPIYPVPTRLENAEQAKLASANAFARRSFAKFLLHVQSNRDAVLPDEQAAYWHEVETPYISFYAFEEVPAAFMEEKGSQRGLLAPMERLSSRLSDRRAAALKPEAEDLRQRVVAAYAFKEEQPTKKEPWDSASTPPGPFTSARIRLVRWLEHWPWETATAALVAGIAVVTAFWLSDSRRVSDLSKALTVLTAQVNQTIDIVPNVRNPNAPPNISDASLAKLYTQLKALEASVNALNVTVQLPPQHALPMPQVEPKQ